MRITPTKILNIFTGVVLVVLLWTVFSRSLFKVDDDDYTCDLPPSYIGQLHRLVYNVHNVLDNLDLRHFLCYGSLFGQVRRSSSLPWEKDAEFCVLNEEMAKFDEVYLKRIFAKNELHLSYDSAEGLYVVKKDNFEGYVQLVVFAADKEISVSGQTMLHRVGWKRRLLPPDCDYSSNLHCFPKRLSEAPLPLKLFGTEAVPVPREEFEILKYHFPNNWWREEKPSNC